MTSKQWAKTSLVLTGAAFTESQLVDELGEPAQTARGDTWIWDIESDDELPLQDQLVELEKFLTLHRELLTRASHVGEITINISWSPRSPQDGIGLWPELTRLIGELGAAVLIDTYIDESGLSS